MKPALVTFFTSILLTALLVLGAAATSCSGTAVHRPFDELACEDGHGCGVAFCECEDEALLFTSMCEADACVSTEDICERRCAGHGGVRANAGHSGGALAAPLCGQLCERLRASGCQTGCPPLFDECVAPSPACDPGVTALFDCMAQEAVLSCEAGAIAIAGCSAQIGFCQPGPAAGD
jgi:hypothetical protein